jgi:membrane protease YdiL (CAAX protease family)
MRAMPDDSEAPQPGLLVLSAAVFYAVMSAAGLLAIWAQGLDLSLAVFGSGEAVWSDALYGIAAGLATVGATVVARRFGGYRRLEDELMTLLGRPSALAVAALAVTSAIGEELLFRGGLQPLLGIWATTLLFGVLHGAFTARLRAWAVFATVAGLLLGFLADFTGNLLAPMLCHLTVNYFNLLALARWTESPPR